MPAGIMHATQLHHIVSGVSYKSTYAYCCLDFTIYHPPTTLLSASSPLGWEGAWEQGYPSNYLSRMYPHSPPPLRTYTVCTDHSVISPPSLRPRGRAPPPFPSSPSSDLSLFFPPTLKTPLSSPPSLSLPSQSTKVDGSLESFSSQMVSPL